MLNLILHDYCRELPKINQLDKVQILCITNLAISQLANTRMNNNNFSIQSSSEPMNIYT